MNTKLEMFTAGESLLQKFCQQNKINPPEIKRLQPEDRLYHLATCAFYRPKTISIMVSKCANKGYGGRAWSWPGYAVDRTPFGVLQHELGHHIDAERYDPKTQTVFSKTIYGQSGEKPLTGYLGTDKETLTFFMEWFAENFRLFVTNAELCRRLRPRFYSALRGAGIKPVELFPLSCLSWHAMLTEGYAAPDRIVDQARKKILEVEK